MKTRGSGVLLHITSLPSPYGIGDLGPEAYRFVDFLSESKQVYWQILPLNPTVTVLGNSPYSSPSAFAGNPILVSPEALIERGFLSKSDFDYNTTFSVGSVDYEKVTKYKESLLQIAYEKNKERLTSDYEFMSFCHENSYWLDDYALFISLKGSFNLGSWSEWPMDLRDRHETSLKEWREKLKERILKEKFIQYLFFKQWASLKDYCRSKNIHIIGDIPIYVTYDSSDVWTNPDIFKLGDEKLPTFVAGVPPDYFSKTGQLWGNPVYRWEVLRERDYSWWIERVAHNLKLIDFIRLDHFRGFVSCWEVPAEEETAINGKWIDVPVNDFFNKLFKRFPSIPIIAEDLGFITADVREVISRFDLPGMRLLLFAFGNDFPRSTYLPHNYVKNCVIYTGTHDNNTVKGWFMREASLNDKKSFFKYIGREVGVEDISWEMIRLAMSSVADTVIIPMQDIIGLGEEARMNLPSTTKGNWQWRLQPDQLTQSMVERLRDLTETYGRA